MTKSDKSLEILEKRKRIYYKDVINILIFIIGMIIIWCEAKALYNNYLVKNYYAISYNTLIIFIMIGVNIYNVINKINEDKYKIYAKKNEKGLSIVYIDSPFISYSNISSIKIPYPFVASLTKTWVIAPISFPSCMIGVPLIP